VAENTELTSGYKFRHHVQLIFYYSGCKC